LVLVETFVPEQPISENAKVKSKKYDKFMLVFKLLENSWLLLLDSRVMKRRFAGRGNDSLFIQ
jgi:hypothetical protein